MSTESVGEHGDRHGIVVWGRVLPSEKKKRAYIYNHVMLPGFVQACICLCHAWNSESDQVMNRDLSLVLVGTI